MAIEPKPHPIWGFKPGICQQCHQQKKVGVSSCFVLPRFVDSIPFRVMLQLNDRCEDCYTAMGLGRNGVFVAVPEGKSVIECLEAELKIARDLDAERRAQAGKPKLY